MWKLNMMRGECSKFEMALPMTKEVTNGQREHYSVYEHIGRSTEKTDKVIPLYRPFNFNEHGVSITIFKITDKIS